MRPINPAIQLGHCFARWHPPASQNRCRISINRREPGRTGTNYAPHTYGRVKPWAFNRLEQIGVKMKFNHPRTRCLILSLMALTVGVLAASRTNVAGKWEGEMAVLGKTANFTLELTVDGKKLNGSLTIETDPVRKLEDGKVDDDSISFGVVSGAHDVPRLEFQGKVDGDRMKLTITGTDIEGGFHQMGEATARRVS